MAGGVFEQDTYCLGVEVFGCFDEGLGEGLDGGVFVGMVFGGAGMDDYVFGSDGDGTLEFAAEGGDGFGAVGFVFGAEVYEVVGVDD